MRKLIYFLVAAAFGAFAVATPALPTKATASTATIVSVTAGKPSEFKFKLSRTAVPTGKVVFRITNAGNISHDFKILGHKSPTIAPHKSATLTVTFTKAGVFAYLCTIPGHATAGMKGVLRVSAPVKLAKTHVAVTAGKPSEFRFTLTRRVVPRGAVTFTVTNRGSIPHDFKFRTKKTRVLAPGQSQTITVSITRPGTYPYLCTVAGHAVAGMKGTIVVK